MTALVIFGILALMAAPAPGASPKRTPRNFSGVVVLDPGHGGRDHGVRGPAGALEKTVALALARRIQARFADGPRVVLTRTDDYQLDIYERTAMANHHEAALFISLHVGGSHRHQASGANVFYLKQMPEWDAEREGVSPSAIDDGESGGVWDKIQERHIKGSERLALSIKRRIDAHTPFKDTGVHSAPLLVLEGADMPAILIETGFLTNPGEEKLLKSEKTLGGLAEAISVGIEDFFQSSPSKNGK